MLIEVDNDGNSHTGRKLAWGVIMKAPNDWIAFREFGRNISMAFDISLEIQGARNTVL